MTKTLPLLAIVSFLMCATPAIAQFVLIGDAEYMSPDCIRLTPDVQYSEGIAYHETKMDLANFFEIEFDIYLGDKNEYGADGIAFVIHNDPRGYGAYGIYGERLGYGRIRPSIAIEFDTYMNYYQNDPSSDHVAFLENGINFHEKWWNGEDQTLDLEDDMMHNFRFRWDPSNNAIMVLLDDNIVFQGQRDLVNDIFGGSTDVIWGFTASTGRKHNLQYFCLRKWTHTPVYDPGKN